MWPEYVKSILKCGIAEKAIQIPKGEAEFVFEEQTRRWIGQKKQIIIDKKLSTKQYTTKLKNIDQHNPQ